MDLKDLTPYERTLGRTRRQGQAYTTVLVHNMDLESKPSQELYDLARLAEGKGCTLKSLELECGYLSDQARSYFRELAGFDLCYYMGRIDGTPQGLALRFRQAADRAHAVFN